MTTSNVQSETSSVPRNYETDYYGWIEDQIALLEAGRLSEIDAQNIAEEIKDIGTRQYDKLENALTALVYNLLKWDTFPERRTVSAVLSIGAHRDQIETLLRRNPSLISLATEALSEAYIYATYDMMRDSDLPESAFQTQCPYDWETVRTRKVAIDLTASPSNDGEV